MLAFIKPGVRVIYALFFLGLGRRIHSTSFPEDFTASGKPLLNIVIYKEILEIITDSKTEV